MAFEKDINNISTLYLNELVSCTCLNRHKVKLRRRLDFSWIPRLTQKKPRLLSKFHYLNKVLHSKNQLHDMSGVVKYLFCWCNDMLEPWASEGFFPGGGH